MIARVVIAGILALLPGVAFGQAQNVLVAPGNLPGVSTAAQGAAPTLDGNAAHYLSGTGAWSSPAGGATPGGSTNDVQYNAGSGTFGGVTLGAGKVLNGAVGTPTATYTPTFGAASGGTGKLLLSGTTSGTITVQPQDAAGTFNFNLPITAGSSGNVLTSAGGGTSPMTWTVLAASATTDTTNASNISSGTLASARGGAGTISGALKANGSGTVSQAACADLSNGGTACTANTGTSGATLGLLNTANVYSAQQSGSITTLSISTATFTPDGTNNDYAITLVHASCPCTLANPSATPVAGTHGVIYVKQSATGSDTIGTWGTQYMAPGGTSTIVLSTGANAQDAISYSVLDSTHILLYPNYNFSH